MGKSPAEPNRCMMFKCCHCNKYYTKDRFYQDKSKPSGIKPRCKVCEKLYKNYQLRREYEKEYRANNPDKRRKILSKWYINNKDHHKQVQTNYRKTDQFKINHRKHFAVRRARIKNTVHESIDYQSIYINNPFCFYCHRPLEIQEVEFDHFIPLSKGGTHTTNNIRVSCRLCNRVKGAVLYQVV